VERSRTLTGACVGPARAPMPVRFHPDVVGPLSPSATPLAASRRATPASLTARLVADKLRYRPVSRPLVSGIMIEPVHRYTWVFSVRANAFAASVHDVAVKK